jgi:hypothetical protein
MNYAQDLETSTESDKSTDVDELLLEEEVVCSICLELLNDDNVTTNECCNHSYHPVCINTWLQENNTCPSCRHELFPEEEIPVPNNRSLSGYLCIFYNQNRTRNLNCCYFPLSLRGCTMAIYFIVSMLLTFVIYQSLQSTEKTTVPLILVIIVCFIFLIINIVLVVMIKFNIQLDNLRPRIIPDDELPGIV